MSAQWYLSQEGQQYGPYTDEQLVGFAREGRIVRESMLWAEGMADWLPAGQVEGLFPPVHAVAAPAPVPSWAPGAAAAQQRPAWMTGGAPAGGVPVVKGLSRPVGGLLGQQMAVPGGPYPPVECKAASFGLLAGLLAGGSALAMLTLVLLATGAARPGGMQGSQLAMLILLGVVGGGGVLVATVLQYVYLARLWGALRFAGVRTTAGKAVGFLFVPFFNLYWMFVAFHGLAQDWNRTTTQFQGFEAAPKLSEGVFLTFCIGCFFPPLALVMWFPVMSQICNAINFMAYRPVRQPGVLQFG